MNCPAPLAAALQALTAGLPDATNHYFLKANYYDYVEDNADDEPARCWLAAMWLNEETTRNLELGADELQLDVLLDGRRRADWTRVRIPYSEIWDILHQRTKSSPNANRWVALYYDHAAMRMPPVG